MGTSNNPWISILNDTIRHLCVEDLRNSLLLRAICALNLSILHHNLLRPDLIRGSLDRSLLNSVSDPKAIRLHIDRFTIF